MISRKVRGTRASAATLAGGARTRSERTPSYPADVFPLRRAEEATTLAKGTELSDDGRQQSSTAVRRADGLATSAALGTLFSNQNQYSARANPNATRRCFDKPTAPSVIPAFAGMTEVVQNPPHARRDQCKTLPLDDQGGIKGERYTILP